MLKGAVEGQLRAMPGKDTMQISEVEKENVSSLPQSIRVL